MHSSYNLRIDRSLTILIALMYSPNSVGNQFNSNTKEHFDLFVTPLNQIKGKLENKKYISQIEVDKINGAGKDYNAVFANFNPIMVYFFKIKTKYLGMWNQKVEQFFETHSNLINFKTLTIKNTR